MKEKLINSLIKEKTYSVSELILYILVLIPYVKWEINIIVFLILTIILNVIHTNLVNKYIKNV